MDALLSPDSQWLWTAVLTLALFFPVRQLIWVASVRRDERRQGRPTDDARRQALRRRASFTSALLCFVFAVIYVQYVFSRVYGPP